MREVARFMFEGELLTVSEVQRRVPRLSNAAIRKHLQAGRNTAQAMLTHQPDLGARRRGWKAGRFDVAKGDG